MSNPYRTQASPDFKKEIHSILDSYAQKAEQSLQRILDGIADDIRRRAADGYKDYYYNVPRENISSIFGFRPRLKEGAFANRVFDKLVELGFKPEVRWFLNNSCDIHINFKD